MKSAILATCFLAIGSQAVALSCVRPDPIATFQTVAAAPEPYFVLLGVLETGDSKLPPSIRNGGEGEPEPISGYFRGRG
uniref:Uncharacterized protein n=1 Tax=Yoonia rhodophyticola TaxID=3137370 RepID=A0AAN0NKK3_9RHOB